MPDSAQITYRFGSFLLRASDRQLLLGEKAVALSPKIFETLLLLVENQGRLIEKEEFFNRIWPDSFVEEIALAHAISHVRKALQPEGGKSQWIQTVSKRGYRFVTEVETVRVDSRNIQLPPLKNSRKTMAILPFENFRADPEREYVVDGFTEEVIAALGQVDFAHLSVIGRTSVMSYRRTKKSLTEIGRELGVEFLIESSLQEEQGRLRVISKLIRADDQTQIWSLASDNETGSTLDFQREFSHAIARKVRLWVSSDPSDNSPPVRQTQHAEAYDLYLQGRYLWNQLSAATTKRAVACYTQATELDPDYALAWSGLATCWATSPISGDAPPLAVWARARDASARAMEAGAHLPEVQTSFGFLKFWLDWEWAKAETAFRKALTLDPSYSLAHRLLGIVLSHMGRHEEAASALREARTLDPLDATHHVLSAQVAFNGRDYAAATQFANNARNLQPRFWIAHYQLAMAQEQSGEDEAALESLNHAQPFSADNSKIAGLRGYLFGKLGRFKEAAQVIEQLKSTSRERYVPLYASALVHAGMGEQDAALDCLERAVESHDVHLTFLEVDAKWDRYRSHPRFRALVERCAFGAQG